MNCYFLQIRDGKMMNCENLLVKWEGPFSLMYGNNSVFEQAGADQSGLYLWVVQTQERKPLVYYVGIASKSIAGRLRGHVASYLGGEYWVYDPEELKRGTKRPIYQPTGDILDFAREYRKLAPRIMDCLDLFSIYYAPVNTSAQCLMRLESGIIDRLRCAEPSVRDFLDNARVSARIEEKEKGAAEIRFPDEIAEIFGDMHYRV